MNIKNNSVVTFDYTLTDSQGQVIDSSKQEGAEPLVYLHGIGFLIPGLEKELEGKTTGDSFKVQIEPKDAYGERNDGMVQAVPKSEFQDASKIQVGSQFQMDTDNGPIILTVIEVQDENIVVDGNHPLAGVTLNFDVTVQDVREATEEELAHGHVHGPGGHQH